MQYSVPIVNTEDLMKIYKLVNREGSWDAINWKDYPTVPGLGPDCKGITQLKNDGGLPSVFSSLQIAKIGHTDVIIQCQGGQLPCHRILLMHFSPFLKNLIADNLKDIGTPSAANPIVINMMDFELLHVNYAIQLFYSGNSSFPVQFSRHVYAVLDFLKVDDSKLDTIRTKPIKQENKTVEFRSQTPPNNDISTTEIFPTIQTYSSGTDSEDSDSSTASTATQVVGDKENQHFIKQRSLKKRKHVKKFKQPETVKKFKTEVPEDLEITRLFGETEKPICVQQSLVVGTAAETKLTMTSIAKVTGLKQSQVSETGTETVTAKNLTSFVKVPPGSLINRVRAPRIQRNLKPNSTKKTVTSDDYEINHEAAEPPHASSSTASNEFESIGIAEDTFALKDTQISVVNMERTLRPKRSKREPNKLSETLKEATLSSGLNEIEENAKGNDATRAENHEIHIDILSTPVITIRTKDRPPGSWEILDPQVFVTQTHLVYESNK